MVVHVYSIRMRSFLGGFFALHTRFFDGGADDHPEEAFDLSLRTRVGRSIAEVHR